MDGERRGGGVVSVYGLLEVPSLFSLGGLVVMETMLYEMQIEWMVIRPRGLFSGVLFFSFSERALRSYSQSGQLDASTISRISYTGSPRASGAWEFISGFVLRTSAYPSLLSVCVHRSHPLPRKNSISS